MQTISELCARYDNGAGVSIGGGTFAIYSVASLPQRWHDLLQSSSVLLSRLAVLASAVASTIPIYHSVNDLSSCNLISLPRPLVEENNSPLANRPWFLINAAVSERHCIVGNNSLIESLLAVLRRPWCILEICCSSLATVDAMLDFAVVVAEIDQRGYSASVVLLSHEKTRRKTKTDGAEDGSPLPRFETCGPYRSLKGLQEVCAVIFAAGIRSYNAFWLGLICVCGVELDISFSELSQALYDTGKDVHMFEDGTRKHARGGTLASEFLAWDASKSSADHGGNIKRSMSAVSSLNELQIELDARTTKGAGAVDIGSDVGTYLISVYAQVLQKLADWTA